MAGLSWPLALGVSLALAGSAVGDDGILPSRPPAAPLAPAAMALAGVSVLHRLQADEKQLRFEGEIGSRVWAVFVTDAQLRAHARARLAYTNAVSVMPEGSRLTISINDVVVAETSIGGGDSDRSILDVDIPPGVLETGFNSFRISVRQRHRVDCSVGATYELWTQVAVDATGIAFTEYTPPLSADPADLPATEPDATGALPIRAVLPAGTNAAAVDRMFHAIEAVSLRGAFLRPTVEIASEIGDAPGLTLVVGTFDELRRRGLPADEEPISLRAGSRTGQATLVIGGASPAEIDATILQMARGPVATGTPAGLRALANMRGTKVDGESTISFRDLGVFSQEFSGRLFRVGFDIVMPADFYSAEYGKASLNLHAGYVGGLSPGSQILIRVNERDASSLPLPNPRGDVFRNRALNVSLADLRPGLNHIQIDAQLAMPADQVCDVAALADRAKRFVLLEQSEFVVPRVARIAHMPNLSGTAATGFPFANAARPVKLYVPRPDQDTIAAAATFLARTSGGAGTIIDARLVFQRAQIDSGDVLIVGALNDLPPGILDSMVLDGGALTEVWSHFGKVGAEPATLAAPPKPRAMPPQTEGGVRVEESSVAGLARTGADPDLYEHWSTTVRGGRWDVDLYALAQEGVRKIVGFSSRNVAPWKRIDEKFAPNVRTRLILAQHAAPQGGGQTWTLLTAPNAAVLAQETRAFVAPSIWSQVDGRVTAYEPRGGAVAVVAASEGYFIPTKPLTPGNLRLVAAGWFSSNIEIYVGSLLALCLLLGVLTSLVVKKYGAPS